MLQILKHRDLGAWPRLAKSMFKDRANQFVDRLGWNIPLTNDGLEIDQYDDDDALYLIASDAQGRHAASMRLRPTEARTMLRDVFPHMDGADQKGPKLWESTRFCLAPNAGAGAAARVLLAGQVLGLAQGLEAAIGVYDLRMMRVYRRLGWVPDKLSEAEDPSGRIALGAWRFSNAIMAQLAVRSQTKPRIAEIWVDRAKGRDPIFN